MIKFKVIRALPVPWLDSESLPHAATGRLSADSSLCPPAGVGRLLSVTTLLPVSDPLRTVAQRSKLRTFYPAKTSVLSRLGKSQV
jgi:hypothetical protein